MVRFFKVAASALAVVALFDIAAITDAHARGGGSNFMNSPGYQRRLQESRGYVTNQSGSIFSPSPVVTPRSAPDRRSRRRH